MTPEEKKAILNTLLKRNQIDPEDYDLLAKELDHKINSAIEYKMQKCHDLMVRIQFAKLGIVTFE